MCDAEVAADNVVMPLVEGDVLGVNIPKRAVEDREGWKEGDGRHWLPRVRTYFVPLHVARIEVNLERGGMDTQPTEGEKVKDGAVAPEPEPLKPLEYYDHVKWEEWSEMPIKRRMEVQQARIAVGMPSVQLSWGTWEADVALAPEILAKAPRELGELREVCTEHA